MNCFNVIPGGFFLVRNGSCLFLYSRLVYLVDGCSFSKYILRPYIERESMFRDITFFIFTFGLEKLI